MPAMFRVLTAEERRLLELAEAQYKDIVDKDVFNSWHVLVEAIGNQWLGPTGRLSLQRLINELSGGGGLGAEEYSIDVSHEDGEGKTVIVGFLSDRFYAPRAEMIYELRRLQARLTGEAEPAPPPRKPKAAEVAAAEAATVVTTTAAEAATTAPETAPAEEPKPSRPALSLVPPLEHDPDEEREAKDDDDDAASNPAAELGKVIESWAEKLRSPDADKPGSFLATIRAAMDKARAEQKLRDADTLQAEPAAELAAGAAEARAAVNKLVQQAKEIDRGQLSDALHHLAEWVKSPERGGAAIDSLLERIEARLNEAFKKDGGAPSDAENNAANALKKVRDAMAKRIADAAAQKAREAAAAPKKTNPEDEEN